MGTNWILELRHHYLLTQREAAAAVGCSERTWQRWEAEPRLAERRRYELLCEIDRDRRLSFIATPAGELRIVALVEPRCRHTSDMFE